MGSCCGQEGKGDFPLVTEVGIACAFKTSGKCRKIQNIGNSDRGFLGECSAWECRRENPSCACLCHLPFSFSFLPLPLFPDHAKQCLKKAWVKFGLVLQWKLIYRSLVSQEHEDGREGKAFYGVGATKSDLKGLRVVFIEEDKRLNSIN